MTGVLQDLRFGLRMLAKHPTATAVAVLSLALGIGANTAIFSLIDAALVRSLPVDDPDRLMVLGPGDYRGISTSTNPETRAYSIPRFRDLAAQTDVFSGLAAFQTFESTAYLREGSEAPRPAMTRLVSGNYFDVLGVRGKAVIWFRPWEPAAESPDHQYPFWLCTGHVLEHWHTGTMTRRVKELHQAVPKSYCEINAGDAAKLGIVSGAKIRLTSRRGTLDLEASIDERASVQPGHVFVPFFDETLAINDLTLDAFCPISKEPDYKKCAVRVEVVTA